MGASLAEGETAELSVDPSRHLYLVATNGPVEVNGVRAEPRDGVAITGEALVRIKAVADSEIVLVDSR
jgi:redox-sensitive bicupin YhaK (pirin superfamily)